LYQSERYSYSVFFYLNGGTVVVRPSLDGWNVLSCSTTLEKLREEAGEKVYRWRKRK
jgi:hypothetical protein